MKRALLTGILIVFCALNAYPQGLSDPTGNITVVMTGFRNNKGRAQVAMFNSEKGFPLDPIYSYKTQTASIVGDKAITIFKGVPQGEYAICAIHDEDMEGDFDRNWMFLPGEGWGTSNDAGGYFGPGNYHDSRFILDSIDATINVVIHN